MRLWHGILAGAIGFIAMGLSGILGMLGNEMKVGPSITLIIFGVIAIIYAFYMRDEGKEDL